MNGRTNVVVVMDDVQSILPRVTIADGNLAEEHYNAKLAVERLIEEANKAANMLHNAIEAYIPAEHRAAWHADAGDLRAILAKVQQ